MDIGKKALMVFASRTVRQATRTMDCSHVGEMNVKESSAKKQFFVLIRIPNDYDLVRIAESTFCASRHVFDLSVYVHIQFAFRFPL